MGHDGGKLGYPYCWRHLCCRRQLVQSITRIAAKQCSCCTGTHEALELPEVQCNAEPASCCHDAFPARVAQRGLQYSFKACLWAMRSSRGRHALKGKQTCSRWAAGALWRQLSWGSPICTAASHTCESACSSLSSASPSWAHVPWAAEPDCDPAAEPPAEPADNESPRGDKM